MVSFASSGAHETQAIMSVIPEPDRLSARSFVRMESRYGVCPVLELDKEWIHVPSTSRLLLMLFASTSVSPDRTINYDLDIRKE